MNGIVISPASSNDLPSIEQFAKNFDLDWEEISCQQFIVAKKENKIIGFGRLRDYESCTEIATVGVIHQERNKGVGTAIVQELLRKGPSVTYVTCVIPDFFFRIGFVQAKEYPAVLQKKVDFCKCYDFSEEQIFVMKHEKR